MIASLPSVEVITHTHTHTPRKARSRKSAKEGNSCPHLPVPCPSTRNFSSCTLETRDRTQTMPRNAFSHRTAGRHREKRDGERRSRGMRLRLTRELSLSTENQNDRLSSLQKAFLDWKWYEMVWRIGERAAFKEVKKFTAASQPSFVRYIQLEEKGACTAGRLSACQHPDDFPLIWRLFLTKRRKGTHYSASLSSLPRDDAGTLRCGRLDRRRRGRQRLFDPPLIMETLVMRRFCEW